MPDLAPVAKSIMRRLNILLVATAVLGVVVVATAVYAVIQASSANGALCTLRADYQHRVDQTSNFIDKHPHGALGFTPDQLKVTRKQQQRTVDSLGSLDC